MLWAGHQRAPQDIHQPAHSAIGSLSLYTNKHGRRQDEIRAPVHNTESDATFSVQECYICELRTFLKSSELVQMQKGSSAQAALVFAVIASTLLLDMSKHVHLMPNPWKRLARIKYLKRYYGTHLPITPSNPQGPLPQVLTLLN